MKRNPILTGVPSGRTKPLATWSKVKLDVTMTTPTKDKKREITNQDFEEIRRSVLSKRSQGVLPSHAAFVDKSFPPDISSLTYVYSGDDKYERMIFRRPQEVSPKPMLYDVYSPCPMKEEVCQWTSRQWLLPAITIVSLNPAYMKRLIPTRQNMPQNFTRNYSGAFLFLLWRFGEWIEVVIDDYLPMLDGQPAFCPAFGDPPSYWPALLEKAYAKCNKAYEAIEVGSPLSALTHFTGAVCEHFKPNECITNDLFHVLYKSSVNRSLIVGWRSVQSFQESTIRPGPQTDTAQVLQSPTRKQERYGVSSTLNNKKGPHIFVVTGATKFPLRDGRMLEMIRLKCPYDPGVTWWGNFSIMNPLSWHSLHPTFAENYKPKECLDGNEFWMPYIEFCRHFADLVICSSTEAYLGVERNHTRPSLTRNEDYSDSTVPGTFNDPADLNKSYLELPSGDNLDEKRGSIEITVQETLTTIKLDTIGELRNNSSEDSLFIKRKPTMESSVPSPIRTAKIAGNKGENLVFKCNNRIGNLHEGKKMTGPPLPMKTVNYGERTRSSTSSVSSYTNRPESGQSNQDSRKGSLCHIHRNPSVASNLSEVSVCSTGSPSDSESTNSTSEIRIRLNSSQSRQNVERPSSAPAKSPVPHSSPGKYFNASIFETRVDYFRPHGSWRIIVNYFGAWTKSTSGGPPCARETHSWNPRVLFMLSKADAVNEVVESKLHGTCHILINLVIDQRRGSCSNSGMLADVGFTLYKSKTPEKDEKRHLSKLQMLHDVKSEAECREVTSRFDLEPGFYMLVPYINTVSQEGQFLVRILGEKDQVTCKTGCSIS